MPPGVLAGRQKVCASALRAYLAGKSVMNSSGTSSWRGTGRSGCLGQEMKSRFDGCQHAVLHVKYCVSDLSLGLLY